MAADEMFESSLRSTGDLGGVFEYDGETGYFYLYNTKAPHDEKVLGAIRVFSGPAEFREEEVNIRWDTSETKVGLFIRGNLCAVFDVLSGAKYGGDDRQGARQIEFPLEILLAFGRLLGGEKLV